MLPICAGVQSSNYGTAFAGGDQHSVLCGEISLDLKIRKPTNVQVLITKVIFTGMVFKLFLFAYPQM
jgi:hypothetical protein